MGLLSCHSYGQIFKFAIRPLLHENQSLNFRPTWHLGTSGHFRITKGDRVQPQQRISFCLRIVFFWNPMSYTHYACRKLVCNVTADFLLSSDWRSKAKMIKSMRDWYAPLKHALKGQLIHWVKLEHQESPRLTAKNPLSACSTIFVEEIHIGHQILESVRTVLLDDSPTLSHNLGRTRRTAASLVSLVRRHPSGWDDFDLISLLWRTIRRWSIPLFVGVICMAIDTARLDGSGLFLSFVLTCLLVICQGFMFWDVVGRETLRLLRLVWFSNLFANVFGLVRWEIFGVVKLFSPGNWALCGLTMLCGCAILSRMNLLSNSICYGWVFFAYRMLKALMDQDVPNLVFITARMMYEMGLFWVSMSITLVAKIALCGVVRERWPQYAHLVEDEWEPDLSTY